MLTEQLPRALHLKELKYYPIYSIDFEDRMIVIKPGWVKEEEIKRGGGHHCSSCSPEFDDTLDFDQISIDFESFKRFVEGDKGKE